MSLADDLQLLLKEIRKQPLYSWVDDRRYYLAEIDRHVRRAIAVVEEIERAPEPKIGRRSIGDSFCDTPEDKPLAAWRDRLLSMVRDNG